MNLLKRQNPAFTSLFDDLIFNQGLSNQKISIPAVNIIEADDRYDIQLATPGKKKSDFQKACNAYLFHAWLIEYGYGHISDSELSLGCLLYTSDAADE